MNENQAMSDERLAECDSCGADVAMCWHCNATLGQVSKSFPYTTPSGHIYHAPTDYRSLSARVMDYLQSVIECWDEDESPPNALAFPEFAKIAWNEAVRANEESERLRAEISKRDRLNKDVIGELNDMRAENERLRHVLERIRDSECGVEAGKGDWCGGSIERGRIHDKDCPARWALAALNPEANS